MMFSDMHIHALCGVDDGARSEQDMYDIIDASYADGVRFMCLTPHFHPGYYGNNGERSKSAFDKLNAYVGDKYPDMKIALGNELHYDTGCLSWITEGYCRTMNGSKYLLMDFTDGEKKQVIYKALNQFLNSGYIPILAHAERYRDICGDKRFLEDLRGKGILIQVDCESIFGAFGHKSARFSKSILAHHLADFVSSDAHDLSRRPPGLKKAYDYIERKYGGEYARRCCYENAKKIFFLND